MIVTYIIKTRSHQMQFQKSTIKLEKIINIFAMLRITLDGFHTSCKQRSRAIETSSDKSQIYF